MGVELELYLLIGLIVFGASVFDVFEVETPSWRKILKWLVVVAGTVGLYYAVGHWALVFPFGFATLGLVVHVIWCRKNGIHPLSATPRRKYYELRGWKWPE